MVPETPSGYSPIRMHQGNTLLVVAETYPTLMKAIVEAVQNTIDEDATKVQILVNHRSRRACIRDNGNGSTKERFEKALLEVNVSSKKSDKLGRFGRGVIAPLNKCREFTFTSCPRSRREGYHTWTFNTEDIKSQYNVRGIPIRPRIDIVRDSGGALPRGKKGVWWSTEIEILDFVKDRVISKVDLDELVSKIRSEFGKAIRRKKTEFTARVIDEKGATSERTFTAAEPTGTPLEVVQIADSDAGMVTFKMFLTRKTVGGRKGSVVVGETSNDFTFPFATFIKQIDSDYLPSDVKEALLSGHFEGEITATGVELHPSRRMFREGMPVVGFCAIIDKWWRLHGNRHYQSAHEERRNEEFLDSANRCIAVLKGMLRQPAFQNFSQVLDEAREGSIGSGHNRRGKAIIGPQDEKAVAATAPGSSRTPSDEERERSKPRHDHPDHRPFTILSEKGQHRDKVRDDSLGLQVGQVESEENLLWQFDPRTNSLLINTYHPAYRAVEHDAKSRERLIIFAAIQAFSLYAMPEEYHDQQRLVLTAMVEPYAFVLQNGDVLSGRTRGRVKADPAKSAKRA